MSPEFSLPTVTYGIRCFPFLCEPVARQHAGSVPLRAIDQLDDFQVLRTNYRDLVLLNEETGLQFYEPLPAGRSDRFRAAEDIELGENASEV
jgi:hypothetical protein